MKKTLKSLLGAVLAGSLLIVGCDSGVLAEIEQLQREQEATNASLKAQMEMINAALQSYKDIVNPQLLSLQSQLNAQLAQMVASDNALAEDIEALKLRITALETVMSTLQNTTIPNLEARIEANKNNLEDFEQLTAENFAAVEELIANLKETKLPTATFEEFKTAYLNRLEGYEELKAQLIALLAKYDTDIARLDEGHAANAAEIALLKSRVQSLVFVPRYKDLKFGIPFATITDGTHTSPIAYNNPEKGFEVIYKVAPDSLADKLAKLADKVFTFAIETDLQTRALAVEPKLTILGATGDNATGRITFELAHEGFEAGMNGDTPVVDAYAVSLRVDEDSVGVHVASEYTGTVNVPSPKVIVDMSSIYEKKADDIAVAYTKGSKEFSGEIEYIDTTARNLYTGCFLAAKVENVLGTVTTGPFSYDSLSHLGFKMPVPSVRISAAQDECAYLQHGNLQGAVETTVRVKKAALKSIKEHLVNAGCTHVLSLKYAFDNGIGGTLIMPANVALGKVKSLNFQIGHDMKWTYALDAAADHANIGPSSANYERAGLVSVPVLVKEGEKVALDGSDAAYGIVASDFSGKAFTKASGATVPSALKDYDYDVEAASTTAGTVTLKSVAISSWGTANAATGINSDTLSLKGQYVLPFAKESNATVKLSVTDRDRKPINIKVGTFPVTLRGGESLTKGGKYKDDNDCYLIQSEDLAAAVYAKYVDQGIFTATSYSRTSAFGTAENSEFKAENLKWFNTASAVAARFGTEVVNNTTGGALYIKSNAETAAADKKLTSASLLQIAQNYAADGTYQPADPTKTFTYSFLSYIGQEVNLTWSLTANPVTRYRLKSYLMGVEAGSSFVEIPGNIVWTDSDHITKANTELDFLWTNNVFVATGPDGSGGVDASLLSDKGLVPVFTLADNYPGVEIVKGQADSKGNQFSSLIKYYGHADEVVVKSALYIKSGESLFYVPGSDSLYVYQKPVTQFAVKKFNPFAAVQELNVPAVNVSNNGSVVIPLTFKDINPNYVIKEGVFQDNEGHYAATIKEIFGDFSYAIKDDAGNAVTGFSVYEENKKLMLRVSNKAAGTYSVKLTLGTLWEDYEFVLRVNVL